jgi:hypothetical protein
MLMRATLMSLAIGLNAARLSQRNDSPHKGEHYESPIHSIHSVHLPVIRFR